MEKCSAISSFVQPRRGNTTLVGLVMRIARPLISMVASSAIGGL
jgi:hypothetical protein